MNNRARRRKVKLLKGKMFRQSLVVSIVVIIILLLNNAIFQPTEVTRVSVTSTINTQTSVTESAVVTENKELIEVKKELTKEVSEVVETEPVKNVVKTTETENVSSGEFVNTKKNGITYYNISLSTDLQTYAYEISQLCPDVSYELVLAMLYTESEFDANAKGYNNNGTVDQGIAQINSDYTDHYAEVSGLYESFDPYNAEHGIKACACKLQTLADVWKNNGVTDSATLELYSIQSYHMGVVGFKNYKAKYGASSSYSNLVLERKNQLLTTNTIV